MRALATIGLVMIAAGLLTVVILAARAAATSHAERRRLGRQLASTLIALDQIEVATDRWKDIESVLATDIRTILRAYRSDAILIPPPPPGDHAP